MDGDYQFEDAENTGQAGAPASSSGSQGFTTQSSGGSLPGQQAGNGGGGYAKEIFSKQIKAKFRTFFVDLKESGNGKFVKISEKSHGRKSTVMMDAEDLPAMIEALQEVQKQL
ncbi:MAG: hypothetical protein V1908_04040 [Candidatus Peregrinibacteria bacterium]